MALSPVQQQKVHQFRTQHGAKFDGLLQDVQAKKPGASQKLADAVGISRIDALDLAQSGVDALANDKGVQGMFQGQAKTAFQADAGGGSAGATLRGHGHFNDDSIVKNTIVRRFQGGQVRGISPLVQGVPKNPYGQNWERNADFKEKVPAMEEPEGKWDIFPMGDEYTTAMCKDSLDKVEPEVTKLLEKFQGSARGEKVNLPLIDFHVALRPLIGAATKKALDTLPDDLKGESPNLLRKHLAQSIAGEGAKLVDNMTFPDDPERQFTDHDLKKHVCASVIKGALAAFDIEDASDLLKEHNAQKTNLGDGKLHF